MSSPLDIALDIVAEREDFYASAAADLDLPFGHEAVDALAEQRAEEAARAWLETEAYHVGEAGEDVFESLDDALTCALEWAREVNEPIEIRRAGVVVETARPAMGAA